MEILILAMYFDLHHIFLYKAHTRFTLLQIIYLTSDLYYCIIYLSYLFQGEILCLLKNMMLLKSLYLAEP